MPRSKKKRSPSKNASQFARSLKANGKWRGKNPPKPYKRAKRTAKKINDKLVNKIEYRKKYEV